MERVPSLMARAGIAVKELPRPEYGEGCERGFAFRFSRNKGTVEFSGLYFTKENRYIIGIGCGGNPLRWSRDMELSTFVKKLLADADMIRAY